MNFPHARRHKRSQPIPAAVTPHGPDETCAEEAVLGGSCCLFGNDATLTKAEFICRHYEFRAAKEVVQGAASVDRRGPPRCKP